MNIERQKIIDALGGQRSVEAMDDEGRAEALETYLAQALDAKAAATAPTIAELEQQIEYRTFRRGVGISFAVGASTPFGVRLPGEPARVRRLAPLPAKPTLLDFFRLRFAPASHLLQSADLALTNGLDEDVVLACLVHDLGQALIKTDHGWWGAQLFQPYVSEKICFAIKYHQALRFFPDPSVGYEYPAQYNFIFGRDYVPPPYIRNAYNECRKHRWYMAARMITVNDIYSFDPHRVVSIEKFTDIIGRHFKQPDDGLGFDDSPVAHMWRSIALPDTPL
jgi:hypothetical protein